MNTYGSEGPARVDIPGGNILLPLGTRIQLSGDVLRCGLPAAFISEPGDDAESLTLNWVGDFIKEVGVPDDCISFSWARDASGGYMVSVLFHPLTPERHDELTRDDLQVCFVCAGPCDDADKPTWTGVYPRALNCIECNPCFLCDRCKVMTRRRSFTCYACLSDEEWAEAKVNHPSEELRMNLLEMAVRDLSDE